METLVATVLIVVLFMVASLVLNNLFINTITKSDQQVRQELLALQYQFRNAKLELPYTEEMGAWRMEVSNTNWLGKTQVEFRAIHIPSKKEIVVKEVYESN